MARAYWGRSYNKWIIGDRIFYTDEFWSDLFSSLVTGVSLNFGYLYCLSKISDGPLDLPIILAAAASTPILLFATRQYDRCWIADEEVDRRQKLEPSFSGQAEMRQLLSGDQMFIRRIIGRHAPTKPKAGE